MLYDILLHSDDCDDLLVVVHSDDLLVVALALLTLQDLAHANRRVSGRVGDDLARSYMSQRVYVNTTNGLQVFNLP